MRCVQLTSDNRCAIYGSPERPAVCSGLRPSPEMCGDSATGALIMLTRLELETWPGGGSG